MKTLICLLVAGIGVIALTGCGHPKITQTPDDEHYRPLASWVLAESAEPSDAASARGFATPVRVDQSQPGVVHIAYSVREDEELRFGNVRGDQIVFFMGDVGALDAAEAQIEDETELLEFNEPRIRLPPGVRHATWVTHYDLVSSPEGVETGGRRVFWLAYFGDLPDDGSPFDLVLGRDAAQRFVPLTPEARSEAAVADQEGGKAVVFEGIDSSLRLRLVPPYELGHFAFSSGPPTGLSVRHVAIPPPEETDNLLVRYMRDEGLLPTPWRSAFTIPRKYTDWVNPKDIDWWNPPPEPWPGMRSVRPIDPESIDAKFDFDLAVPAWSDDDHSPGFRTLRTMR